MPGCRKYKTLNNYNHAKMNSVVNKKSPSLYGSSDPGIPASVGCLENSVVTRFGSNSQGGVDIVCSPINRTKSYTKYFLKHFKFYNI